MKIHCMNSTDSISNSPHRLEQNSHHRLNRWPRFAREKRLAHRRTRFLSLTKVQLCKFLNKKRYLALCVVSICALWSNKVHAADPTLNWEVIETPRFIVVHNSEHRALAESYAGFAEQAFTTLSPVFGVWPEKTVLVIDDSTDQANGFATGLPYPLISVFPALPTALDSIGNYGNWGAELVMHEYAHILNFEPASGILSPVRRVFGTLIRPNALLPRWYLEGLATEIETRFSKFGRLRSSRYLAIPRAMVEENSLLKEDISRINETSIPDWPGGIRPYLMGALLWNEITNRGGVSAIRSLNDSYSSRIPFLINQPAVSLLGVNYSELLDQTYARIQHRARNQIDTISTKKITIVADLPQSGFFNHSPRVSPDGSRLAFVTRDHNVPSAIDLIRRKAPGESFSKGVNERATKGMAINRMSWLPDSSGFIYDDIAPEGKFRQTSDIWRFDLANAPGKKGRKTQISRGLRAREPVVSPDGEFIVFAQLTPGSSRLSAMKIDGNIQRVLFEPSFQNRISHPEFISPDEVVFTQRTEDGKELLRLLKVSRDNAGGLIAAPEGPRTLLDAESSVLFPRHTREGLLFVSDRTGIGNVYLAAHDYKSSRALTNVTTDAMTGEIDPQTGELVFSRLTAHGPRIVAARQSEWMKTPERPVQAPPLIENSWPEHTAAKVVAPMKSKPYSAAPFLIPRYWLPLAFFVPEGTYFQASTSSTDPIGRHLYSLTAASDTLTTKPSLFVRYDNRSTERIYSVLAQDYYEYLYSGGLSRHTTAASVAAHHLLPTLADEWDTGLAWQYLKTDAIDSIDQPITRSGIRASLGWSNASKRGLEISPEAGSSLSLSHTHYLPGLGNIAYDQTDFSASTYFSGWLPERHVLALSINASLAPELTRSILGRTTVGGTYQSGLAESGFLMRGYSSGVFIGKNLISATAEYRLPFSYNYSGLKTTPLFLRRLHASFFTDALTLDGVVYDFILDGYRSAKLGQFYWGSGLELKADTTIFYHLPAQFIFGLYYGSDKRANPRSLFPFFGISL
jgi:Tol biopolymer transport system component